MILALRTATPTAEIYLLDAAGKILRQKTWLAERRLARDLLAEIEKLVGDWTELTGLIVFRGTGSFTGLRIGVTTANALAYAQNIPVVGVTGDDWLEQGFEKLRHGQNDKIVLPEYGAPPHITTPKK